MERIKNLDRYQKAVLLILVAMAVIFAVVYTSVISRIGYLYNDQILEADTENGNLVYQAQVRGEEWRFTVTPDKTVTFQAGDKLYGPYTAKEDPTAIPRNHDQAERMTGVEVREKDKVLFRGGIMGYGEYGNTSRNWMMFHEDGTSAGFEVYAVMGDGTMISGDGTMISGDGTIMDPMEPTVTTILRLMEGPELTHKGVWQAWIAGVLLSLVTAVSILFADELFRWNLVFRVRDVDRVEPSDWEIAGRYISWTLMPLVALAVYIMGLK